MFPQNKKKQGQGSKYNPIIIDDDEDDDVDNDALDALFRTQVGNTYQLWY